MRTNLDQYIINKIREKRLVKDISQEDLSIRLGFKSNSFVGAAESPRSTKKYNIVHINKAAIIFDCSLWDLIPQFPLVDNKEIKPYPKRNKYLKPM